MNLKNTILWCTVVCTGLFPQCSDKTKSDRSEVKSQIEEILKIQEDAYGVHTDEARKRIRETCMDSLVYVGGDNGGFVASADFYVNDLADGYIERPHDRYFQIYDDMVIVTSLHQGYKLFNHDTLLLNSRSTKIFKPDGDKWKMAYVTYASLPLMYYRTEKIGEKMLKQYEGQYQLDSSTVETISARNGTLISTVGKEELALIPLNDSTFMTPGFFGKAVFTKDKNGSLGHYYFEWIDGQRINFQKAKTD